MESQPLVSIIIPTYNRAHLISETLESVLEQTYAHWECIVVDDDPAATSENVVTDFVKKDGRFQYHKRPENRPKGANACRNYGFELSRGQYINWFDDDDLMHQEKLELQVAALQQSNDAFSVCQTSVFVDNKGTLLEVWHEKIISPQALYDFITQKLVFLTQAPMYSKTFLLQNHLFFDEDLQAAQEWEFICRVLYYSPQYHTVETPLVLYRKHPDSLSQRMNFDIRKWHYFLARKKVYQFLNTQKAYADKGAIETYLIAYLKGYFRAFVFSKQPKKISDVYYELIRPMYGFFDGIKILLFIYFVRFTGKGYGLRNKIIY